MKKTIHFSKGFLFSAIFSGLVIVACIVMMCVKGLNYGLDFKPGIIEEIKIAPAEVSITYDGTANVNVQASSGGLSFVVSGIGAEKNTYDFLYIDYPTVQQMSDAINTIPQVHSKVLLDGSKNAEGFLLDTQKTTLLSKTPLLLHLVDKSKVAIPADELRQLLSVLGDVQVKEIGTKVDDNFQIRVGDDGTDPEVSKTIQNTIASVMDEKKFFI